MSIPIGRSTCAPAGRQGMQRPVCTCGPHPRHEGRAGKECPACRAYKRKAEGVLVLREEPPPPHVIDALEQAVANAIARRTATLKAYNTGRGLRRTYEKAKTDVDTAKRRLKRVRGHTQKSGEP